MKRASKLVLLATSWAQKHWVISSAAIIFVLWQVLWIILFTPIKNPWPQDSFTIKGRFPFDQGYDLMFAQQAYGSAEWHKKLCGGGIFYLLGVKTTDATCSGGWKWIKPKKIDEQHYEVKIYKDEYLSGPQDWKADTHHVQFKSLGNNSYKDVSITSYREADNYACDGGDEAIKKFKGKLICMPLSYHEKYKNLIIYTKTENNNADAFKNFWLIHELDSVGVN